VAEICAPGDIAPAIAEVVLSTDCIALPVVM
jgi:hypothetical protein